MSSTRIVAVTVVFATLWLSLLSVTARAEQQKTFGDWEVHYIVLPTTFLAANIAQKYDLVRGNDWALVNISVVHKQNGPTAVELTGEYKNLLSQVSKLDFVEVREGAAVYYLAQIKHTDRDLLRFKISVTTPQNPSRNSQVLDLEFQQTMYANP